MYEHTEMKARRRSLGNIRWITLHGFKKVFIQKVKSNHRELDVLLINQPNPNFLRRHTDFSYNLPTWTYPHSKSAVIFKTNFISFLEWVDPDTKEIIWSLTLINAGVYIMQNTMVVGELQCRWENEKEWRVKGENCIIEG